MKTFNLLGFVLLTLSACAAPGSSTAGPSYKVKDNMAAISVTAGDRFTLKMTENSGTGFQWTADFDEAQISLIDKSYSGGDPKTDGGAETLSFVFKGLAPGQTEIAFHLARAGDTTIETRTVSVTVTEEN